MKTKEKEKNKEEIKETSKKVNTKKVKEKKANPKKEAKKAKLNNIRKAQAEIEIKIDELKDSLKGEKDKLKKKEVKKQIKELKIQRKEIGEKDTYLRDVKKEMRLVRWPSAKEVFKYSFASLVFILFFALFFFGIDALFSLVKDLID